MAQAPIAQTLSLDHSLSLHSLPNCITQWGKVCYGPAWSVIIVFNSYGQQQSIERCPLIWNSLPWGMSSMYIFKEWQKWGVNRHSPCWQDTLLWWTSLLFARSEALTVNTFWISARHILWRIVVPIMKFPTSHWEKRASFSSICLCTKKGTVFIYIFPPGSLSLDAWLTQNLGNKSCFHVITINTQQMNWYKYSWKFHSDSQTFDA